MTTATLPDWITPVEGFKHRYVLDPDKFYPAILKELNVQDPDQYWLEITHQIAKLDAQIAIKAAGLARDDVSLVLIIRGDEGYKDRWALKNHDAGQMAAVLSKTNGDRKAADKIVAGVAREHYKRLRGFLPA